MLAFTIDNHLAAEAIIIQCYDKEIKLYVQRKPKKGMRNKWSLGIEAPDEVKIFRKTRD